MLAGAAFAQDAGTRVSGRDSPESRPDWTVLDMVLKAAVQADDQYPEGGEQFLTSGPGVSRDGARALVAYTRSANAQADTTQGPSLKSDLCPRRQTLVAGDALARAVNAHMAARAERRKQTVEGAYGVLGSDDAAKLRHYVTTSRDTNRLFETDLRELAAGIGDPRTFLDRLCGGAT